MNILHVCKKYPDAMGGDAIVVANLEKQQTLAGHEVSILTSNCKEIKNNKNVSKFGRLDTPSSLDGITLKRLISLCMLFFTALSFLRKNRPDVIHTHSIDMAYCISFAARRYNIPIIHTFHAVTFNDSQQSFARRNSELFFLRRTKTKKIIVLNPADISDFNSKGFMNVTFVPNGVDIDEWEQTEKSKKNSIFTFISVGRLEKQKGFKYLIQAATILKKEGKEFQIIIVGEGSQFELLTNLIKKNDLNNEVSLLGNKNHKELRELYAKADAFILSSLWEEFPLTILEAWASKLPVIVTNVGAIHTICKDKQNALVVQPKDPSELANAMNELLKNKMLNETLSKNGFEEVIKKYNWETINKSVMKIYEE